MAECSHCNDSGRVVRTILNLIESCNHCRIAELEQEKCIQSVAEQTKAKSEKMAEDKIEQRKKNRENQLSQKK